MKPAGRRAALSVACLALLPLAAATREAEEPPDVRALLASAARSHSGRFYVLAPDSSTRMVLIRWAEQVADRVERLVGVKADFSRSVVRIAARSDPDDPSGRIEFSRDIVYGRSVERLTIYNPDRITRTDADAALCRILISVYAQPWRGRDAAASEAPAWLSIGLAQNLYPELRARNSRGALRRWEAGKMPTIADFLRMDPDAWADDVETCGLLVAWFLSLPGRKERFESLVRGLAESGTIEREHLVSLVPGCKSTGDLEEGWDRWLWKQRSIVYEPGEVYPEHLDRLKAELLIFPDVSGIRLEEGRSSALQPRDLIALKDRRVLAETARVKTERLRALAVGRGGKLVEVADAYCRFFGALAAAKDTSSLEALLKEAEDKMCELEHELEMREAGTLTADEPAEKQEEQ